MYTSPVNADTADAFNTAGIEHHSVKQDVKFILCVT